MYDSFVFIPTYFSRLTFIRVSRNVLTPWLGCKGRSSLSLWEKPRRLAASEGDFVCLLPEGFSALDTTLLPQREETPSSKEEERWNLCFHDNRGKVTYFRGWGWEGKGFRFNPKVGNEWNKTFYFSLVHFSRLWRLRYLSPINNRRKTILFYFPRIMCENGIRNKIYQFETLFLSTYRLNSAPLLGRATDLASERARAFGPG